jgi:hypothetical protein
LRHRLIDVCEFRAERGKVTPLHLHPDEDEGFYVLEGEVLVHVEGEEHRVGEGGVFITPRGTPHALMVTSETVRFLSWQTPGTGEAFYRGSRSQSARQRTFPGLPIGIACVRLRSAHRRSSCSVPRLSPPRGSRPTTQCRPSQSGAAPSARSAPPRLDAPRQQGSIVNVVSVTPSSPAGSWWAAGP